MKVRRLALAAAAALAMATVLIAAAALASAGGLTSSAGPGDLCAGLPDPAPGRLTPSRDLYCMRLVPAAGLEDVEAAVSLLPPPTPFGAAVTPEGRHRYDAALTARGLPDPSTLGPYSVYVAWLTTPLLTPMIKLGEVGNGTSPLGSVDLGKFLILVSAEASADVAERRGRLVLRGRSPSTRMRSPDFFEFALGGAAVPDSANARWRPPPMPPGLTMLPALMALRPPVEPFLPRPGDLGAVPMARPREVVRLGDGDSLELVAGYVRRELRGHQLLMYGFNGQVPGPLLWVPEAARVVVNFRNEIDLPTTVHWHGVRLENRFDGVPGVTQEAVPPGGSFRYEVLFRDPGIYWYHPHHREDIQQDLGLYGNLMVRSSRPDYFGPANREEVLMLDDLLLGDEGLVPFGLESATHALMGRFGNLMLVNGEPRYELIVPRGEVVRFFLTNVSNTRTFNLSFGGARMKVVGSDVGNFEREAWAESVVIAPAERYIIHVRFDEPGEVPLLNRVAGIDHLYGRFRQEEDTLGVVRVRESASEPDHGAAFDRLRAAAYVAEELAPYREHFDRPVDQELVLTMETRDLPFLVDRLMQLDSAYFNPVEWSGTMPMMNWSSTAEQVEWVLLDPATGRRNMEIDWRFRVGELVKLRLSNERRVLHAMQHPIHIHGQRFLVLTVNGVPGDNLVWKDTLLLPAGATADILLELSNPGSWMLHCHIAEHLDSGMKMVFRVEGEAAADPQ